MYITHKCKDCGNEFRKDEMLQYASPSGKSMSWYCKDCYEEKLARERFSRKVCEIFQLKSPGPRIWTERKRLKMKYGYTDDSIIDCLEFLYKIQMKDKIAETLALVGPRSMAAMKLWKSQQQALGGRLIAASNQVQVEKKIVKIPEPTSKIKKTRLDDDLFDD